MYFVCVLATYRDPAAELLRVLGEEGLSCLVARDIQEIKAVSAGGAVEAVLLDGSACGLEDIPWTVQRCQEIGLPLLCGITADQMGAYDVSWGASDFFISPPQLGEVSSRIKKLIGGGARDGDRGILRAGDMVIDLDRYEVSSRGRRIVLTYKEYQLLCLLASYPGKVYTREALMREIWGYDYFGGTRTVDVHIRRLRSKIEGAASEYIETVWNVGYRFRHLPSPVQGV